MVKSIADAGAARKPWYGRGMDAAFWQNRWDTNQLGFHEGAPNRFLLKHGPAVFAAGARVLVPLCGKAVDLAWLAGAGHAVVGCELVELAARAFFSEHGLTPAEARRDPFSSLTAGGIEILVGDALSLTKGHVGPVDALFDRAALIALPEATRPAYGALVAGLLPPGAPGILVTLEHDVGEGPPFSVDRAAVDAAYASGFDVVELEREDITEAHEGMRKKGATTVVEVAYRLRRR